jgi:DNA polymerase-3 subunit alpha
LELELGILNLPKLDVPEGFDPEGYLRHLCDGNIENRYDSRPAEVVQRLDYELSVIAQTGYTGYFLTVADFIREAKGRGMLVGPGRGSATGSVVSYLLGITDIDPLAYHLIFERMLNPERVSPPDIDLDFPDDRREDIIDYVRNKYGADHVAQVITFSRMGPRASVRDVGRVLGVAPDKTNELCKLLPGGPKANLTTALEESSELAQLIRSDDEIEQVIAYARGVEGLVRHVSVHAAAVVISDRPLTDVVPLCGGSSGVVTTQYSMDDVTACGLVKMDFLGLKTLTVISNALEAIAANHGQQIAIHQIPLDDPPAYELLCRAGTAAVFQLESEGMQNLLRQLQPERFEHIIALVALYRPGPMRHANEFCAGRHGADIQYLHPLLEPILSETYGVILYQEQVMKIASELAGFSMPQAEIIMRAMAKKMHDKMAQMKPQFMEGCLANGVPQKTAQAVFERMETFSDYGFNKSHSAAYALVAYWTAYLKANYPAEFMAAHLSTVMESCEDVAKYVMECRRMGLQVRPPSVNVSQTAFSVADNAIVFGLAAIRHFGKASAEAIVTERDTNGPYQGISDFCRRVSPRQVSKSALRLLVQAGAFDEFGDRNALLAVHESAFAAGQKRQEDQSIGQSSLFDNGDTTVFEAEEQLPIVPPMSDDDKLEIEKEILGLYITDHPLIRAQDRLETCCSCLIEELGQFPDNETVIVGGMVGETKRHTASNGSAMMFITLEGLEQTVEVTLFPRTFEAYEALAVKGEIIIIEGQVQRRSRAAADGEEIVDVKLLGKKLGPLQGAKALSPKRRKKAEAARERQMQALERQETPPAMPTVHIEMDLTVANRETITQLQQVIQAYPGNQPVVFEFRQNGIRRRVRLGRQYQVNCDPQLVTQARHVLGVTAVWI